MASSVGIAGASLRATAAIFFSVAAATTGVDERCGEQTSQPPNDAVVGRSDMLGRYVDLDTFDNGGCLSLLQVPHSAHSLRKSGAGSPISQLQSYSSLAVMDSLLDEFIERGRQAARHIYSHGMLLTTGNPVWTLLNAPLLMLFAVASGMALYGLYYYIKHAVRPRKERSPLSKKGDTLKLPSSVPVGNLDVSKPRLLPQLEKSEDSKFLCPELAGMFRFWMPMIGDSDALKDGLQKHMVLAIDSSEMFSLSVLRQSAHPTLPSCGPEDYITLSLPGVDLDLVIVTCGRLEGSTQRECDIFRSGQGPFGKITSNAGRELFCLTQADGQGTLTARVICNDSDRTIDITDKDGRSMMTAKWTKRQGAFKEYYEVACTPGCDVPLSIVMVAGIDRILLPVASSSDAVP